MDLFTQKCNKVVVKISLHQEKQSYKQTHSSGYFTVMVFNTLVWTIDITYF